ncbi:hypothetical protein AAFC00_005862 [Neodothiora populina]|uniref:Glycoside hydrolase family 43 protein n=1 Tax=Neodothiora populina TaxID=2781224 RepID=A0ABR3P6F0_9PEZI
MIVAIVLCAVFATIYQCGRGRHRFPHPHLSPIRQAIYANFPDPAIIEHEGMWYAFATNNAAGILKMPTNQSSYEFGSSNVQIATSKDYANWTLMDSLHDPLPTLGAWVTNQMSDTHPPVPKANVWAPEILQRPDDGKFIMYYSAAAKNATGSHCIGAAISDSGPAGPYTALDGPIVCPVHVGGAIDPVSFVDVDGTMYIAWKIDGNNAGHGGICGNTVPPLVDTPIRISRLKADGVTLDGEPISIMDREKGDGPLVEAPSLIRTDDGFYFLFFSSGCTRAPSYDVKYAWAKNVTGPYTRGNYPLLKSGDFGLSSPGSIGMRRSSSGQVQMAFHARITTHFGRVRAMYTTRLQFNGTSVALGDPIPVVST